MNQDWIINYNEEILQHEHESDNTCDQQSVTAGINSNNINGDSQELDGEDEWSEDEVATATDFWEVTERQNILNVAPP